VVAGRDAVKSARKEVNGLTHELLGFQPSPGGTGWQVDLERLVRYILWQAVRDGVDPASLPDTIELRITYDGAEVGGHPGVIAYVVPMNLGHSVQASTSAYPLMFCRCQEKGENLRSEFSTICNSLIKTGEEGVVHEGRAHTCTWYQSMDLASFWKQCMDEEHGTGITCNCKIGYCWTCKCNHKNHHKFAEWAQAQLDTAFHITTILPIPKSRTVFCALHSKLRVTEKLLTLLAATAHENGAVQELLAALRSEPLNLSNIRINTPDDEHKKVAVSSLYGTACDTVISHAETLATKTGETNYKRVGANEKLYGPTDPNKKTTHHLKAWFKAKSIRHKPDAKAEELRAQYMGETSHAACPITGVGLSPHPIQGEVLYQCPVTLHTYRLTNRLRDVQQLWKLWREVDGHLRQVETLNEQQLGRSKTAIDMFGALFLKLYSATNVTCYIHIICCHAHALLLKHGSIGPHMNQGVEAAHKIIRQMLNFTSRGGGKWYKDVTLAVLERWYRIDVLKTVFTCEDLQDMSLVVEEDGTGERQLTAEAALGPAFSQLISSLGKADVSMHTFVQKRQQQQPTIAETTGKRRRKETCTLGHVVKSKKQ
jgi:hypothetical protein